MTPEQAIQAVQMLHNIIENKAELNGKDRDTARQTAQALIGFIDATKPKDTKKK